MAGPRRPQDRVALTAAKARLPPRAGQGIRRTSERSIAAELAKLGGRRRQSVRRGESGDARIEARPHRAQGRGAFRGGDNFRLTHGSIVIAAITSCTNTSNPSVMLAAGLLAKKAVARGLTVKPWVKTSLAPGSKVVTQYLKRAGLTESLEKAALQPGRLRLHDLYRQQRAGRGGDRGRDQAGQFGRVRDSQRQSQFRRAHQSRRALQLPGVAAAGRCLRDCRHDGYRRRASAARHRIRRASGVPARHLAVAGGGRGRGDRVGSCRDVQERVRAGVRG